MLCCVAAYYYGTTKSIWRRLLYPGNGHLQLGGGHTATLHKLGFNFSNIVVDFWLCGVTASQVEGAAIKQDRDAFGNDVAAAAGTAKCVAPAFTYIDLSLSITLTEH